MHVFILLCIGESLRPCHLECALAAAFSLDGVGASPDCCELVPLLVVMMAVFNKDPVAYIVRRMFMPRVEVLLLDGCLYMFLHTEHFSSSLSVQQLRDVCSSPLLRWLYNKESVLTLEMYLLPKSQEEGCFCG